MIKFESLFESYLKCKSSIKHKHIRIFRYLNDKNNYLSNRRKTEHLGKVYKKKTPRPQPPNLTEQVRGFLVLCRDLYTTQLHETAEYCASMKLTYHLFCWYVKKLKKFLFFILTVVCFSHFASLDLTVRLEPLFINFTGVGVVSLLRNR